MKRMRFFGALTVMCLVMVTMMCSSSGGMIIN